MSDTAGDKFYQCWTCGEEYIAGCVHHCPTGVRTLPIAEKIIVQPADGELWRVVDGRLFRVSKGSPP